MSNNKQTMMVSALVAGLVVMGASSQAAMGASVSCGDVLTADTTLDSDLACSGPAALVIGADNITVDLNGHTLTGDGMGVGIDNSGGFARVTIKNGTLTGFAEGIHAEGADRLRVNAITVIGANGPASSTGAIHILGGEDVQIRDCDITLESVPFGPHGIRFDSVNNVVVQNVYVDGGWNGVSFMSVEPFGAPTTGRIQNCTILNGVNAAVLLGNTDDARVQDNEMSDCWTVGMQIGLWWYVSNIRVSGNYIHDNGRGGIYTWATLNSQISDNVLTDNAAFGINLDEGCVNNAITGNRVTHNGARGIVLTSYDEPADGVNHNRISGNTVLDNGSDGISLLSGTNIGNRITDNVSLGNGGWDLFHNDLSSPNFWNDNTYNTKFGADIP